MDNPLVYCVEMGLGDVKQHGGLCENALNIPKERENISTHNSKPLTPIIIFPDGRVGELNRHYDIVTNIFLVWKCIITYYQKPRNGENLRNYHTIFKCQRLEW